MEKKNDIYKFSRLMYIFEAALEYFISIMVGTVYIAKMTAHIGISDSVTGILSSFISLGNGFQIIAIFLANKRPVKRWVTCLHIICHSLFSLVWLIPIFDISLTVKTVLFIFALLSANIIHKVANSPKINWYMSLVDNDKRGRFTANKEIVSLIAGMAVNYLLGIVVDYFETAGDMRTAFIVCGISVFVLTILHSLTMILSKEKPIAKEEKQESTGKSLKELLKNKDVFKIVLVSVLWNIGTHLSSSFMGTYLTKELALSMTFISVVSMIGCFARAVVSRPMGKLADKYSFSNMLILCFALAALSYLINAFAVPNNGKVIYAMYYILNCLAMAGINSSVINLIYDYVEPYQRTSALALKATFSGFAGFFTTLLISPFFAYLQEKGDFFGLPLYAQQVLSFFSFLFTLALILYMVFVVRKMTRKVLNETQEESEMEVVSETEDLQEVAIGIVTDDDTVMELEKEDD